MADNWIRADEAQDVTGSIRHTLATIRLIEQDPLAWKWVVIALHSALQGACVCHLVTTAAPVGAVKEHNAEQWLAYFEASRADPNARPPKTYLMELPELLKAVRKPHSAGDRSNATGVLISDSEFYLLRRFHTDFRNQFVHFEPMGWSIEVSGIPEITKLIVRIIGDISEIGWAFRHQECTQREELRCTLKTLALMSWPT